VLVHVNGRLVPEEAAKVSVFDRGFLYGDGLFETLRVYGGRLFLWEEHLVRWSAGAALLGIRPPMGATELKRAAEELLRANGCAEAMLRMHLSRGVGRRGYSPRGAEEPTLVLSVHPVAPRLAGEQKLARVVLSKSRLGAGDPLAAAKHASQLLRVLARAEADAAGADEALLANEAGHILEATSANLFWFDHGVLHTPPLDGSILPGTTRALVIELAGALGIPPRERHVRREGVIGASGAFLTSAGIELLELGELDGQRLARSALFTRLQAAFRGHVYHFARGEDVGQ
jgi:branched-chain amino acid aminotransferase